DVIVFTPSLDPLETVVTTPTVSFSGHVEHGTGIEVFLDSSDGKSLLTTSRVDMNGHFSVVNMPLAAGSNSILVQATTDDDDRSREAALTIIRSTVPGKVRDLSYEIPTPEEPEQVLLTWLPPENE